MTYTYPNQTSFTPFDLFNFVSQGEPLFMPVVLLIVWAVTIISSIGFGARIAAAWVFASFVCVILSIPMVVIGLLAQKYMVITILMLCVGAVWIKLEGSVD